MTDNKELVKVKDKDQNWDEILETESVVAPFVDIYETEEDFVLMANMPGVSRDDVKIKLEEGSLSIFGKINYDTMIKRKYILNENEIGNYFRKFRISNSVDEAKIEAQFENGQLIMKLPKHDRIKPRTITIK
ncbi:MAG TPA: Hsp20/alpha crystallin family protein [Ignavibacteriaceae bacterium]|nr:Hsp20/alpha crystallin family protein [Ignavibacteriaceae bacterium]